jgi:hypothetical protein
MKDSCIRQVVMNHKEIDDTLNQIDVFKVLSQPTKTRMRNFIEL